jgi:predicted nucleic acid-binding protein
MYLLDTNVISEMRKAGDGEADRNVIGWFAAVNIWSCFVSVITLLEIEIGILRMERRDQRQGARMRTWMEKRVLPEFSGRELAVDGRVALRCAKLHVPDPRSERDAMIAATALVHGMSVVTRDVSDFAALGVKIVNPWDA